MKISELPFEVKLLALLRQKECINSSYNKKTDSLFSAFCFEETKEGHLYWQEWQEKEKTSKEWNTLTASWESNDVYKEPKHYDNTKGSLYKFCDEQKLNSYEFDIIKRVMRCRKKGLFLEDLEKTKFLIDLYIKEEIEKHR